jgi:hypothetical protein
MHFCALTALTLPRIWVNTFTSVCSRLPFFSARHCVEIEEKHTLECLETNLHYLSCILATLRTGACVEITFCSEIYNQFGLSHVTFFLLSPLCLFLSREKQSRPQRFISMVPQPIHSFPSQYSEGYGCSLIFISPDSCSGSTF